MPAMQALRRLPPILAAVTLLFLAASAQIVASGSVGAPTSFNDPHLATASANAKIGIALPGAPHFQFLWNMAGLDFDRMQRRNGGSIETGLEAWISPARRPAQSHGPLLLADAGLGRRFGTGLHGFTAVGLGAGWSIGDWIPFVEFRRRASFDAGRPDDRQYLVGVKFILFG